MANASDRLRVELMFRSLDISGKGALEKVVLEALAAKLNPDMSFSPFQLAVIADEICHCYAKFYTEGQGLSLEGLLQLYEDNPHSLARDFDLLSPLTATAAAAATDQPSLCISSTTPSGAASSPIEEQGPSPSAITMHPAEAPVHVIGEPPAEPISEAKPDWQSVPGDAGSSPGDTVAQGSIIEQNGMLSPLRGFIQQDSTSAVDKFSENEQFAEPLASPESSLPVKRLDFSGAASGQEDSPVRSDRAADIILRALMGADVTASAAVSPSVSLAPVSGVAPSTDQRPSSTPEAPPSAFQPTMQSTRARLLMTNSQKERGGTYEQATTLSSPSGQASSGTPMNLLARDQPAAAAGAAVVVVGAAEVAVHRSMLQTPSASSAVGSRSKPQSLMGTPEMQAADMLTACADIASSSEDLSQLSGMAAAEAAQLSGNRALSLMSTSTWQLRHGNSPLPELEADSSFAPFSFMATATVSADRLGLLVQPFAPLDVAMGSATATGDSMEAEPHAFSFSTAAHRTTSPKMVSPVWAPLRPGFEQQQASPEALAHATLPAQCTSPEDPVQEKFLPVAAVSAPTSSPEPFAKHLTERIAQLGDLPSKEAVLQLFGEASGLPDIEAAAAHLQMAAHLVEINMPLLAVDSLKAALATTERSNYQRILFRLGSVQFGLQQYSSARQSYISALQVATCDAVERLRPKILLNLGITLELEDCLPQACDSYRAALALDPGHSRLHKLLGSALFALGDLPAAEAALLQSLALNPEHADAWCDLGATLLAAGRPNQARSMLDRAVALEPGHIESLYNMGNMHRQAADYLAALRCYDAVLEVDARHWKSLLNKSVALIGLERHTEAQDALQKAYKLAGPESALHDEIKRLKQIAAKTRP